MLMALTPLGWIIRGALVALLAWAGWEAVRLARADHQFRKLTRRGLQRAVELDGGDVLHLVTLAQSVERDGGDPAPLLRRAAVLSPYDADVRIRLGLVLEAAGNHGAAEQWLLEAARVSRKYDPRWTLANYYFRRGRAVEFWRWAQEALEVSYGDRTPLFDLCAAESGDLGELLHRAAPARPEVRLALAQYAAARGRLKEIAGLVEALASGATAAERQTFRDLSEGLVREYRIAEARRVWTTLGIEDAPFGWHAAEGRGIGVYPRRSGGWRVSLDGTQPERIELLWRVTPVEAGSCGLTARIEGGRAGLKWVISRHAPGGGVLAELSGGGAGFEAPAGVEAVRVALWYERPSGAMRREGSVELERVEVVCGQ